MRKSNVAWALSDNAPGHTQLRGATRVPATCQAELDLQVVISTQASPISQVLCLVAVIAPSRGSLGEAEDRRLRRTS